MIGNACSEEYKNWNGSSVAGLESLASLELNRAGLLQVRAIGRMADGCDVVVVQHDKYLSLSAMLGLLSLRRSEKVSCP
ncbi:unnamed protein product [Lepidochelys kempii]